MALDGPHELEVLNGSGSISYAKDDGVLMVWTSSPFLAPPPTGGEVVLGTLPVDFHPLERVNLYIAAFDTLASGTDGFISVALRVETNGNIILGEGGDA